ncbi:MAG: hypothetical protein L3J75_00950 [Methylococcaceae bacterium]|nr:hypothetical protein [Methylococcaceae bacterium]
MLQRPALAFNSGSDGSFGPVDASLGGITTIDLPPDGIIHATTINIARGNTLKFNHNALNTPVYLLATGDIVINGSINISGTHGNTTNRGQGGPGGFDGGLPSDPPGAGFGPGAGLGGDSSSLNIAGNAGHKTNGGLNTYDGKAYGSDLLIPIIGGSGGGAIRAIDSFGNIVFCGGGGGGGAIVISSNTRIVFGGIRGFTIISAGAGFPASCGISLNPLAGAGSGGAIRLVAPVITGGVSLNVGAGSIASGRIRVDAIDRSQASLTAGNNIIITYGTFMQVFPPVIPQLDITDVAGQIIAVGAPLPISVTLPFNSPPTQSVTIQASDFTGIVPIRVVFTPDSGVPVTVDGQIDMSTGNPASTTLTVDLPQNVLMRVNAWTL